MTGPQQLADAMQRAHDDAGQQQFTQGTVTAVGSTSVTVNVAGSPVTAPYLGSYRPAVGDVVWLAGPPGTWFALGALAPRGGPLTGVVARAARTSNSAATAAASEVPVLRVFANVKAGRLYNITCPSLGVYGSLAGGYAVAALRATTDGTPPSITSPRLTFSVCPLPAASTGYAVDVAASYPAPADQVLWIILTVAGSATNNVVMQAGATYPVTILVEDVGPDPGNSGVAL